MGFFDILGGIGNVLDLPGSSFRDIATWKNPFDQWHPSNWTSSEKRATGRDVLRISDRESTGLNTGASIFAELMLDPLNLLAGIGLLKRIGTAKKIKAANALSRGKRAEGFMPEEIAAQTLARTDEGPVTMLHGTAGDFFRPDPEQWSGSALYGPGHYMTESESAIPAEQLIARAMHKDDYLRAQWAAGDPVWSEQARGLYRDLLEDIGPMRPVGDPLKRAFVFEGEHSTKPIFQKLDEPRLEYLLGKQTWTDSEMRRHAKKLWGPHPEVRVKDITLGDVMTGKTDPKIQEHIRQVLGELPPKEKEAALELFNLETRHPAYKPEAIRSAEVAEGYAGEGRRFSLTGPYGPAFVEPEDMLTRAKSFLADYDTYMERRPYDDYHIKEFVNRHLTEPAGHRSSLTGETGLRKAPGYLNLPEGRGVNKEPWTPEWYRDMVVTPHRDNLARIVKEFDDMPFDEWHRKASKATHDMQRDYQRIHGALGKRDMNVLENDPALWGMHKKHFELIQEPEVLSRYADIRRPFELNKVWSRDEIQELSDEVGKWFETKMGGDSEVIDSLIDRMPKSWGRSTSAAGRELRATGGEVLSALHEHLSEMNSVLKHEAVSRSRDRIIDPATKYLAEAMKKRLGLTGSTELHNKSAINELLSELGYDAIKHIGGGRVTSSGQLHNVWIALDPERIYKPFLAPAIKKMPKLPWGQKLLRGAVPAVLPARFDQ